MWLGWCSLAVFVLATQVNLLRARAGATGGVPGTGGCEATGSSPGKGGCGATGKATAQGVARATSGCGEAGAACGRHQLDWAAAGADPGG